MNTTYFLNTLMNNIFQVKTAPPIPKEYYLGLSTSAPNVNGEGATEPGTSGTAYARVKLTDLSEAAEGEVHNTAAISFNESTADWGVVTHYVVYDAATEGKLLFYGELEQKRTVEPNTLLTIKVGELSLKLSNPVE